MSIGMNHYKWQFEKSKDTICAEATKGLAYFDTGMNTLAITDWSKAGIAFTIFSTTLHMSNRQCPILL